MAGLHRFVSQLRASFVTVQHISGELVHIWKFMGRSVRHARARVRTQTLTVFAIVGRFAYAAHYRVSLTTLQVSDALEASLGMWARSYVA